MIIKTSFPLYFNPPYTSGEKKRTYATYPWRVAGNLNEHEGGGGRGMIGGAKG